MIFIAGGEESAVLCEKHGKAGKNDGKEGK